MTDTPPQADQPQVVAPVSGTVSALELDADKWAQLAGSERLPRLRAVATAWGATVTAITAIFGLATLTDSDSIVEVLDRPFNWLFGLTAVFAAILSSISVLLASLAAQQSVLSIPPDLPSRVRLYERTFTRSLNALRASRWFAGFAIVFLILNFMIRWYAPRS